MEKKFILVIIFILFVLIFSSFHLFADNGNNDNKSKNTEDTNIIEQINKNYDQPVKKDKNEEIKKSNTTNSVNSILLRTFLVSVILLIIYIVVKIFFNKYAEKNQKGILGEIIFEEYFYKNYKIGIMKVLEHYYLVSLAPKFSILYEFTSKEDIDNILLLKSKKVVHRKSFVEFIKDINPKNKQSLEKNDFLKSLKQKINNISRSQDE